MIWNGTALGLLFLLVGACQASSGGGTAAPTGLGGTSSGGTPWFYDGVCNGPGVSLVSLQGIPHISGPPQSNQGCQFSFALVESSTFYGATHGLSPLAIKAFLNSLGGKVFSYDCSSRAADFCRSSGGEIQDYPSWFKPDSNYSMCVFSDGSSIEEWTLYYGSESSINQDFVTAISN